MEQYQVGLPGGQLYNAVVSGDVSGPEREFVVQSRSDEACTQDISSALLAETEQNHEMNNTKQVLLRDVPENSSAVGDCYSHRRLCQQ